MCIDSSLLGIEGTVALLEEMVKLKGHEVKTENEKGAFALRRKAPFFRNNVTLSSSSFFQTRAQRVEGGGRGGDAVFGAPKLAGHIDAGVAER